VDGRRAATLCAAFVFFVAAPAFAQDTFCARETACTIGISTSSATTIVGLGTTTMSRLQSRQHALLNLYLRQNRVAVLAAATLGGGDELNDLAALADVAPDSYARFRDTLFRRRKALRRSLDDDEAGYADAVALILKATEP